MYVYALHLGDHDYRYIGITTTSLVIRLKGHRKNARNGAKWPVSYWIRKHYDQVQIMALEEHDDLNTLKEAEIRLITQYKPLGRLLNATIGGDGFVGGHHSIESRKKISDANYGKKRSDETRLNISQARLGFKMSNEQREKLRQARLGATTSLETRAKQSQAHKGRIISDTHREKLSESGKQSYIKDPTLRKRRQERMLGTKASPETRAKLKEAHTRCKCHHPERSV